jgi:hypothetical protein
MLKEELPMKSSGKGLIKLMVVALFIAALVVGYFFYLSNKDNGAEGEINGSITAVQEVLTTDLSIKYPPTPKEVLRFYAQINQVLYNENYTDEELTAILVQQQNLFDEDLKAANPLVQYVDSMKADIQSKKAMDISLSSYALSDSVDVDYYVHEGYECARLHCFFYFRTGTSMAPESNHRFVLRKDADGHWKIMGWELVANNTGVE